METQLIYQNIAIVHFEITKMTLIRIILSICFSFSLLISSASCASTYSMQITAELGQTVTFQITVNGVTQTFSSIPVPTSGSEWINFAAAYGDNIRVQFIGWVGSASNNRFSYVINNGPDGSGTQIYNSRSATYTPVNICTIGTCQYRIEGVRLDGSTVNVFVNGRIVIENFDGSADQFFTVKAGDVIKTVYTYGGGALNALSILYLNDFRNLYIYNAFGENAQIYSRSPFGGYMYPITQEQTSAFATTIGAGKQNERCLALTLPN